MAPDIFATSPISTKLNHFIFDGTVIFSGRIVALNKIAER